MSLAANLHRVFISRLGRIEVYQTIPPPSGKNQVWWRNNVSDHLGIQCVATY